MQEVPAKLAAIEARYQDAQLAALDGVSVDYPDWHFNVRASNTEPLLRLNLEASSPSLMEQKRDEVLSLIRG
jgi:phosphomannomutase